MTMERVDAALLLRVVQAAYLDLTTEEAVQRWGDPDITWDDLGPWNTFVFRLADGTLAGLVREVENAPKPGYFLVAGNEQTGNPTGVDPADALTAFLAEAGLEESRVLIHGSG
ncbi:MULTISPECIES: hypothetical protein [unclassified Streptomyces]|uniref:hypothetical protein n=1 Tax=unclassified Streptomyces TaxID=2593676 RepID=UPI002DDA1AFC|nr:MULTISPECIES: hypothetical protein [unclassified Streptomyces]WSA95972.1 hypothetical protein OIE63_33755 [Streptomyces sp. NBC_01795]WSS11407.1 hypothetical protein OG533_05390 [Streptomyces sp. NBC_01186]WSS40113.1 hypothetical protein OG220_05485 [Streptomyces sp. NBC_01187]